MGKEGDLRHIIRIIFALGFRFAAPVLGVGVVLFWYFWYAGGGATGPLRLADYCDQMRPGVTVEKARSLAEAERFSIPVDNETKLTAETGVMMYQRTFCEMTIAEGKVTASRLFTAD